jgi:hypothetical protein
MPICTKCMNDRPRSDFYAKPTAKKGFSSECKPCEKRRRLSRPFLAERRIYNGMVRRCTNQADRDYERYGGRGIEVCEQWLESFDNFLADMGQRPSAGHSIERINNDLGYSPQNCKWATRIEQANNQSSNRWLHARGEDHTIAQWARIVGIKFKTLHRRLAKGWLPEDAIFRPVGPGYRPEPKEQ